MDHLYIHPDHQGRGLGRTLLKVAQESEFEIRLWTFQCNARAHRFYERNGFTRELETDGANNEERQPDVLYFWRKAAPGAAVAPEHATISAVAAADFEPRGKSKAVRPVMAEPQEQRSVPHFFTAVLAGSPKGNLLAL